MKKVVLNVIAAVLMTVGLGGVAMMSPAYAKVMCTDGNMVESLKECPEWENDEGISSNSNLMSTLTTIINVVIGVVGFIAVAMIVMGGISYATSQGDAAKTKKAMNTVLYGVVGLVVALLAFAIVNFVLGNVFGGEGTE